MGWQWCMIYFNVQFVCCSLALRRIKRIMGLPPSLNCQLEGGQSIVIRFWILGLREGFEIYTHIHLNVCCTASSKVCKQPVYKKLKLKMNQPILKSSMSTRCTRISPAALAFQLYIGSERNVTMSWSLNVLAHLLRISSISATTSSTCRLSCSWQIVRNMVINYPNYLFLLYSIIKNIFHYF